MAALATTEQQAFRNGIAHQGAYAELYGIVTSGSSASLSEETKRALRNAVADDNAYTELVSVFETGAAVTDDSRLECHRLMGNRVKGDALITQLNAIT